MILMVSVQNLPEALEALKGGADIVDVKNLQEALVGSAHPLVVKEVREAVPIENHASVTLGVVPNQAGTVTETKAALDAAKKAGWATVVSARSGETEDVTIAHLSVGWDAGQLKVGSFARSERMAKWNEVLRIEEAMGNRARLAGT